MNKLDLEQQSTIKNLHGPNLEIISNKQSPLRGQKHYNPRNNEIRLLTYNLFLRPPFVKNNKDDYKNERCRLFLDYLENFDVICLQEVFAFLNQRKYKLIYNSMKQGFYSHESSPDPSFFSSYLVDGGLLTLSRFPIIKKEYQTFSYGVLSDNLSQKGVLYTKIQINDCHLHLYNTHLQASYVGDEQKVIATVVTRIDQLKIIRKFIDETLIKYEYKSTDVVMLLGDMNVNALGKEHPIRYLDQQQNLKQQMNLIDKETFSEYQILQNLISNFGIDRCIDCMKETFGVSQVTYGDSKEGEADAPGEIALTYPEDQLTKQSLDYLIEFQPSRVEEQKTYCHSELHLQANDDDIGIDASCLHYVSGSIKVEKFFVQDNKTELTQLSDHYGVSGCIIYEPGRQMMNTPLHRDILQNIEDSDYIF